MHHVVEALTISSAPLMTPHKMLEYHNSFCALPSRGSSTKSASGFSSKMSEHCLWSLVQLVAVGVTLRKALNPTYRWVSACFSVLRLMKVETKILIMYIETSKNFAPWRLLQRHL